jgi:hypothetical protein
VGGTRPLAIDDFVEVVGVTDIGGLQLLVSLPLPRCYRPVAADVAGSLLPDKGAGKALFSKTCKRHLA